MGRLFNFTSVQQILPIIILISAFTPYISPTSGIKGDNIIIYLIALMSLIILLTRQKVLVNKYLTGIFMMWLVVFIFVVSRTVFGGGYISEYSFIAEIKNFSQPLAIMFIFLLIFLNFKIESIELILKKLSIILVFLLSINTLWIFVGWNIDVSSINNYFVRGVANNAAGNNRFTGIFNQPMESGIAYSIGLIAWIYLVSKKFIQINVKYVILLALVIVGGIVSVSKIFIFGGLSIFFINLILRKKVLINSRKLFFWIPIILPILVIYISDSWKGTSYLNRLFIFENYRESGFLNVITAGRMGGQNSQQGVYFGKIWQSSPLIGQGMGSQEIYDSAFYHFFSSGGLIALSIYILILLYLCYSSFSFFTIRSNGEESFFFLNITIIILISSFGSPVLTVNRASVICWVFICLIYVYFNKISMNKERNS